MKHIKKIADYSIVGGLGTIMIASLTGCEGMDNGMQPSMQQQQGTMQEASQKQGAFVIIQEVSPKKYQITDEFPSTQTKVILKTMDGKEKILTKAELDALVKEEAGKIDAGTSELTKEQAQVTGGSGGMGLGGIILSSMAGAMLGSYIGNKLFNNQNYKNNRSSSYKSSQTYNKSKKSFSQTRSKKSGYFNKKNSANKGLTTKKRSSGFFGKRSGSRSFGG